MNNLDSISLEILTLGIVVIMTLFVIIYLYRRLNRQTMVEAQLQSELERERVQQTDIGKLRSTEMHLRAELASLTTALEVERQQRQKIEQYWTEAKTEASQLQQANHALKTEIATSKSTFEERENSYQVQLEQLKTAREALKKEFSALAGEILEQKGKSFQTVSEKSIAELLRPLKSDMQGFKEKVESIHTEETKQRTALKTELKLLQELNQDITNKAEELSNALRGQKKLQGNWGELMLENVLESAGLRAGSDYEREVSINTIDGERRRPDALVYLPQNKHLVIDAKTSLTAYTQYVNAEDDQERSEALLAHAEAVKARIKELSDKQYFDLPGVNSPEVVIMFIPIESAYVEALKCDESLFQSAIEQQVLVATPTTLLTSLNIVRQLWRFEDQSKHSAELASRAAKFYDKLRLFLESMSRVGRGLDTARDSYDKALSQLSGGKANLIKQAAEFKDLGVSVTKELDASLVEQSKLELPKKIDE